jgi:competence protein ComEC
MANAATIYFLDVGQGTSQVILFEDGSLVILDCGRSAVTLLELLTTISFDRIKALILSHLHDDHIGGAPAVLDSFVDRIDHVYIPQDRPAEGVLANKVIQKIAEMGEADKVFTINFLVRSGPVHGKLHPPLADVSRATLSVVYPTAIQSLEAQTQNDVNQGSGILVVECGGSRVLFPGDAGHLAFNALKERLGDGSRLCCDVLAAPHHGGKLANRSVTTPGHSDVYGWLYSEIVDANITIFSVGSSNSHGHPLDSHISAARESGSNVLCTQMTGRCHTSLTAIAPALLQPLAQPSACARSGVGCAGTIVVNVNESDVRVHRFAEHQELVNNLALSQSPLCRSIKSTGGTTGATT